MGYQEDSLGGNQGQGQYGDSEYEYDDQQGQYGEQGQYDDESSEEGAQGQYGNSQNYPDYYDEEPLPAGKNVEEEESETEDNVDEENPAVESYGAPADDAESDIDSSTLDLVGNNDQYKSPISDATNLDSDEYSSPNNRHDTVSQKRNRNKPGSSSRGNGFPFTNIAGRPAGGRKAEGDNSKEGIKEQECPGGSIEECVKVCPGTSLREIIAKRVLRNKSVLEAALRSVSRCVQEHLSGCTEPVSMDVQIGAQAPDTAMQYSTTPTASKISFP